MMGIVAGLGEVFDVVVTVKYGSSLCERTSGYCLLRAICQSIVPLAAGTNDVQ